MTQRSKIRRPSAVDADLEKTVEYLRQAQRELRLRHEQMRALHARMRESQARYQDLFDSAPLGYLTVSPAGRILESNRAATILLGESAILRGQLFEHFIQLEDRSLFAEKFGRCRRGRVVRAFEITLRDRATAAVPVQLALLCAKEAPDTPREVRIIIVNLGELKRTQKELEEAKRSLEERVRERTRELTKNAQKLAAEAAHRVRLEEELLQISERERRRFGQDLHDDICQALTGLALELGGFSRRLAKDQNPHSEECHRLAVDLGNLVRQTRRIAHGLHPVGLSGGLVHALEELVAAVSPKLPCNLHLPRKGVHLAAGIELAIYRIAQEALTNVVKHARAGCVDIRLVASSKGLLLSIEDDGIGLPRTFHSPNGMGLDILGYRARSIGGTLVVENRPKGGLRVACRIPSRGLQPLPPRLRENTDPDQGAEADSRHSP